MMKRYWIAAVLAALMLAGCQAQPVPEMQSADYLEEASAQELYNQGFRDGVVEGLSQAAAEEKQPEILPEPGELPEGFVLVSEAVPDAILEIRYFSTYNFVGERIEGYQAPVAILTEEAAAALEAVSRDLGDQGYRLKIYDAYRPQRAVDHFVRWAENPEAQSMKAAFYPEVAKEDLFRLGYIAARSGHSRGSTVDLTLFDVETGKEADMGGTFDYFGTRSHGDYTGELTDEQLYNRRLLRNAMTAHGFRGIPTEWWHFTLAEEPYPDTYFDFPVTE